MDPLVLLIITLLALSGGGATGAAVISARKRRRTLLWRALVEKSAHEGGRWSIFDVFWDLGVSDYALVLMDHHHLLPLQADDLQVAHSHLADLISAHGSYSEFIGDSLEAIQEFYRDHRAPGSRRRLTLMGGRAQKLLPIDASTPASSGAPASTSTDLAHLPRAQSSRDMTLARVDDLSEHSTFENTVEPHLPRLHTASGLPNIQVEVDIDEVLRLKPGQLLKNIFDGRWSDPISKWWKFRHLRAEKSRLDEALEAFYDFYATDASRRPGFYEMLYDIPRRWFEEAERIEALKKSAPWRDEPFAMPAELLVQEAELLARKLSERAQTNVYSTVEQVHDAARANKRALAGYMLYMNRHAFFAGRAPEYGYHAEKIERLVYQVQRELRKLHREGQL